MPGFPSSLILPRSLNSRLCLSCTCCLTHFKVPHSSQSPPDAPRPAPSSDQGPSFLSWVCVLSLPPSFLLSSPAWKIPQREEPGRLQSMGSLGEKDLESPSSTHLEALVPSRDSRAMTRSPSPRGTVTPAGDRSVRGCWLSSCLRAPCCPEGLASAPLSPSLWT